MRATIELEKMEFRAPHGCYDLEKVVGNRYHVDLCMEVEIGDAPESWRTVSSPPDSLWVSVTILPGWKRKFP